MGQHRRSTLTRYMKNFWCHLFIIAWFSPRRTNSASNGSPCRPFSAGRTLSVKYADIVCGTERMSDAIRHKESDGAQRA
jgi:hypothetical protein